MWMHDSSAERLKSVAVRAAQRRARAIWAAEGRPEGKADEHVRRARAEIEREFRGRVAAIGQSGQHLPLEIEEALTPGLFSQPGGMKFASRGD